MWVCFSLGKRAYCISSDWWMHTCFLTNYSTRWSPDQRKIFSFTCQTKVATTVSNDHKNGARYISRYLLMDLWLGASKNEYGINFKIDVLGISFWSFILNLPLETPVDPLGDVLLTESSLSHLKNNNVPVWIPGAIQIFTHLRSKMFSLYIPVEAQWPCACLVRSPSDRAVIGQDSSPS